MLSADYLDRVSDDVVELYAAYEVSVLADIARRVSKMNYLTSTAEFQAQQAIESGIIFENVIKEIALLTGKSEEEIAIAFESSSLKSLRFDDAIYKSVGLSPVPLAQSASMIQILNANINKTNGNLLNLTRTTASASQQLFISSTSLAQMQVQSGAFTADQAIKMAVKNISKEGLRVDYGNGVTRPIESAVRSNVLTGVNQTAATLTEQRAKEMGAKYYETSAHIGARDGGEGYLNHEGWQGKRFLIVGSNSKYQNFVVATGYGLVGGLTGANCKHSFTGVPEGAPPAYTKEMLKTLDKPDVKYNGKTYSYYEATQKQRYIERKIREWKLEARLMDTAKQDASFSNMKVKKWQKEAREFTKDTGVKRDFKREKIA